MIYNLLVLYLNLIEIFLISILPISLIRFKVISPKFRIFVLLGIFILSFFIIFFQHISFIEIGIRTDNFYPSIIVYSVSTIIAILFLITLAKITKNTHAQKWYKDPHFLFLFIPISFAQQFLFQGFILFKLNFIFNSLIAIIVTALIFGYMHTIYPRPLFNMILGTIAGLFFATLYTIYPNLFVSSITHSILNLIAVYLGFFTFRDSDKVPKKIELSLF